MEINNIKEVLTTGEVASICKVAARTVSKWIDTGRLEGYRIPGSRDRRVTREAVRVFIQKHGLPSMPSTSVSHAQRVLVVDADHATAETLRTALADATAREVRSCHTTFEAGVTCERFSPQWMIVDTSIGMRELCGLIAWLRVEGSTCRVVVMGQAFTPQEEATLRAVGARAILRKPFTLRVLVELFTTRFAAAS